MPERKPPGMTSGHWVDEQIRRATERGEFDNLPGAGKPLANHDPYDEDWWVRQKVAEEDIPSDVFLPPSLLLRKEVAALPDSVRDLADEAAVRAAVREVNQRIAEHIRLPKGPPIPVGPADVEAVVAQWRAARAAERGDGGLGARATSPDEGSTSGLAERGRSHPGQAHEAQQVAQPQPRRRRWFRRR